MKLTDSEREEFIARANATFDPDLWSEEDLPLLRAAQSNHEEKDGGERDDVLALGDRE